MAHCSKGHSSITFHGPITTLDHYNDVIMGMIAPLITSLTIVYSIVYSDADRRKHQSSASLAFVWGIHRGPVNSPHKWPVTRKMFPFDDVIMLCRFIEVVYTWKPQQNGWYYADGNNTFSSTKLIVLWFEFNQSLLLSSIVDKWTLVQVMTWCQ